MGVRTTLSQGSPLMAPADDQVQIDMSNVTVGDIQRLDNPALKALMLQVKKQMEEEATGSRDPLKSANHSVHYLNFYNYTRTD
jgi:hypothetical protein